jgi:hypothetical protein
MKGLSDAVYQNVRVHEIRALTEQERAESESGRQASCAN